jgi:hypothetical protein
MFNAFSVWFFVSIYLTIASGVIFIFLKRLKKEG